MSFFSYHDINKMLMYLPEKDYKTINELSFEVNTCAITIKK